MNAYTLNNIPLGTTHVWLSALDKPKGFVEQLAFFKKEAGIWKVFSRHTGWRTSANDAKWYTKERKEGFFITLKVALKRHSLSVYP
jgi:hypothetical protein